MLGHGPISGSPISAFDLALAAEVTVPFIVIEVPSRWEHPEPISVIIPPPIEVRSLVEWWTVPSVLWVMNVPSRFEVMEVRSYVVSWLVPSVYEELP
jgi:hypothetical protein